MMHPAHFRKHIDTIPSLAHKQKGAKIKLQTKKKKNNFIVMFVFRPNDRGTNELTNEMEGKSTLSHTKFRIRIQHSATIKYILFLFDVRTSKSIKMIVIDYNFNCKQPKHNAQVQICVGRNGRRRDGWNNMKNNDDGRWDKKKHTTRTPDQKGARRNGEKTK